MKARSYLQVSVVLAGIAIMMMSNFATFEKLYPFLITLSVDGQLSDATVYKIQKLRWIILVSGALITLVGLYLKRLIETYHLMLKTEIPGKNSHLSFRYKIISIFLLSLSIRLLCLKLSDNCGGDGIERIFLALDWLKDPHVITWEKLFPQWLPLQTYLIALSLRIYNNPLVSPVLISVILGSLIIFPLSYLVKQHFSESVAILSALIYSFFPLAFGYSLLSMSEIPYNFFVFLSLCLIYLSSNGKKIRYLVPGTVSLSLAGMIRYEGWIFIPILSLLLLENAKSLLIFWTITLSFPIVWMIGSFYSYGDPLYGVSVQNRWVTEDNNWHKVSSPLDFFFRLIFWPSAVIVSLTPLVGFLGFLGIFFAIKKHKHLFTALIFLFISIVLIVKSQIGALCLLPRYTITLGILLIPYSAYCLMLFLCTFRNSALRALGIVVILITIILFSYMGNKLAIAGTFAIPKAPSKCNEMIDLLNSQLKEEDSLIIDHIAWLEVYFKLKLTNGKRRIYRVPVGTGRSYFEIWHKNISPQIILEEVTSFVNHNKPVYLITSQGGRLYNLIKKRGIFQNQLKRYAQIKNLEVYYICPQST